MIIHNPYSKMGGEESVVISQSEILRAHGHEVILYERGYNEMKSWRFGRLSSFFSALYNRRSVHQVKAIIKAEKPDIALIHNLYPVISPAVLTVLKRGGVKTIMTLHNFRLICPTGLFFRHGKICERCGKSGLREWNCALWRCEGSYFGSFAYALRGYWARKMGYYIDNIDLFCPVSDFQLQKLASYGIPAQRMAVIENPVHFSIHTDVIERENFVAFVGRLTVEKGSELLFRAAKMLPGVRFKVAGDVLCSTKNMPANVELIGFLNRDELDSLYRRARIIISTSICYETFGLVVAEAMAAGAVGIVPQLAAMTELVDGGRVGVTYEAGSAECLGRAIADVMSDTALSERLSKEGARYITEKYSAESYNDKLYRQVELITKGK